MRSDVYKGWIPPCNRVSGIKTYAISAFGRDYATTRLIPNSATETAVAAAFNNKARPISQLSPPPMCSRFKRNNKIYASDGGAVGVANIFHWITYARRLFHAVASPLQTACALGRIDFTPPTLRAYRQIRRRMLKILNSSFTPDHHQVLSSGSPFDRRGERGPYGCFYASDVVRIVLQPKHSCANSSSHPLMDHRGANRTRTGFHENKSNVCFVHRTLDVRTAEKKPIWKF